MNVKLTILVNAAINENNKITNYYKNMYMVTLRGVGEGQRVPPHSKITGGCLPAPLPLPMLMHTEIKLQITANTCIW